LSFVVFLSHQKSGSALEVFAIVMRKKSREQMLKICIDEEKKQAEWLREAVEEKLNRESCTADR